MALDVTFPGPEGLGPFAALPEALHGDAPWFSPPFRATVIGELTGEPATVPGGAVRPILVSRAGRPVARAAAIVNPGLADPDGRPIGQVGYFDGADPDGARAALEAALDLLRGLGCRRCLGPMNGGAHRAYRLMTRGFDTAPFLFEPRNPSWHPGAFEAAGFRPVHAWRSFEPDAGAVARMKAEATAATRADPRPFRVDLPDPRDPGPLLVRVHALIDRAFAGHVGYAPVSFPEVVAGFGPLLMLMPPGHAGIVVDPAGRDVGFGYVFPDWFEEVRALRGDPAGWGGWVATARARRLVVHTAALLPEARGTSAMSHLGLAGLRAFEAHGYRDYLPVLATSAYRYWDGHAPATREYALYGREL